MAWFRFRAHMAWFNKWEKKTGYIHAVHPGRHPQSGGLRMQEKIARSVIGLFIKVIPMSMKCCLWKQRGAVHTLPVLSSCHSPTERYAWYNLKSYYKLGPWRWNVFQSPELLCHESCTAEPDLIVTLLTMHAKQQPHRPWVWYICTV